MNAVEAFLNVVSVLDDFLLELFELAGSLGVSFSHLLWCEVLLANRVLLRVWNAS